MHVFPRLSFSLLRLLESGILDRLKHRWFGHGRHICADLASVRPLTLADLLAVLVITPLAAVFSCLLLGAELLSSRLGRRSRAAGGVVRLSSSALDIEPVGQAHK